MVPTDPTGRVPPGQRVTDKFPVLTAGRPRPAHASEWTLTIAEESPEGSTRVGLVLDMPGFRALGLETLTVDIHCVTRWSKLDVRWRGVSVDRLFEAAGIAPAPADAAPEDLPPLYVSAAAEAGYTANLKRSDVEGGRGFVAVEVDMQDGQGLRPLPEAHGGPARLVVPALYFWKSAKWLRGLTVTPFDRKGFWEKLGYHNRGDPWAEQRYRGETTETWRTTLDPALSRAIRQERLRAPKQGRDRDRDDANNDG